MLIEATTKTVPPEEMKGVERLLGDNQLANKFYTKQIQGHTGNLNVVFHWKEPQENAFKDSKKKSYQKHKWLPSFERGNLLLVSVAATKSVLKAVILQGKKHIVDACSDRHLEAFSSIHI